MNFIATGLLAPVDVQSQEYIHGADHVFQEVDGILFSEVKNKSFVRPLGNDTYAGIKQLVRMGKKVCITSIDDKYRVVLTNMIKTCDCPDCAHRKESIVAQAARNLIAALDDYHKCDGMPDCEICKATLGLRNIVCGTHG